MIAKPGKIWPIGLCTCKEMMQLHVVTIVDNMMTAIKLCDNVLHC